MPNSNQLFLNFSGAICTDGKVIGENTPKNEDKHIDTEIGIVS
jgi:hypothetical protein